jgi:nucleoside-diphosphate-sugar epimerase
MSMRLVTVFGGTGFLGRRVVRHLREHEFSVRIASRHPDRSRKLFGSDDPAALKRAGYVDQRLAAGARRTASSDAQRQQHHRAYPHDKDDECYRVVIEPMSAVYPHDAPRLKNELAGTTFVPT